MNIPSDAMRILVGTSVVLPNDSATTIFSYQGKVAERISHLQSTNLNLQDVFFGHEKHWIPALVHVTPVFTTLHNGMLLAPLHRAILPKLRIMRAFPLVMRAALAALDRLGLHSLEIGSSAQAI